MKWEPQLNYFLVLEESISPRETLMAKATSIYHISSAASAGHSLSKEFPKFLRSHINIPEAIMVPFVLEVALSLGGLPQLRDVIDVLKSVVQKYVHLNLKMRQSAWLREIMSDQILQVEEHLINVMVQCTAEWDSIVKGRSKEKAWLDKKNSTNFALPLRFGAAGV